MTRWFEAEGARVRPMGHVATVNAVADLTARRHVLSMYCRYVASYGAGNSLPFVERLQQRTFVGRGRLQGELPRQVEPFRNQHEC